MGRDEGKIGTGRLCINVVGAREGGSFSRVVNNAVNEGKLACSHRNCFLNRYLDFLFPFIKLPATCLLQF